MDIGAWLRSLGLSRYEIAFCDNSIDADVLPDLTDGDLAQLGVNLGDRKRLLKAIASLNAIDLAAKPRPAPLSSSIDAAERRPGRHAASLRLAWRTGEVAPARPGAGSRDPAGRR